MAQDISDVLCVLGHLNRLFSQDKGPVNLAVREFQAWNGLKPDGKIGPVTFGAAEKWQEILTSKAAQFAGFVYGAVHTCYPWRFTRYYVAKESAPQGSRPVPILDVKGKVLDWASPQFFASMALNGSGISDGTLYNVADGRVKPPTPALHAAYAPVLAIARANKWLPEKAGYAGIRVAEKAMLHDYYVTEVRAFAAVTAAKIGVGYGSVAGRAHEPFRTLATDIGAFRTSDPRYRKKGGVVPRGTTCWMPGLVGQPIGSQTVLHDGLVTAVDSGGGIDGNQCDVFVGTKSIAKSLFIPDRGYLWYSGIEQRLPFGYRFGS